MREAAVGLGSSRRRLFICEGSEQARSTSATWLEPGGTACATALVSGHQPLQATAQTLPITACTLTTTLAMLKRRVITKWSAYYTKAVEWGYTSTTPIQ